MVHEFASLLWMLARFLLLIVLALVIGVVFLGMVAALCALLSDPDEDEDARRWPPLEDEPMIGE